MKTLLTILTVMLAITLYGQQDSIYKPIYAWSEETFSSDEYFLKGEAYHCFSVRFNSKSYESIFGFSGVIKYAKTISDYYWRQKTDPYTLDLILNLRAEIDSSLSFSIGAGGGLHKGYIGPAIGLQMKKGRFSLDGQGTYAYMTKEIRENDPNSWYSVSVLWKTDKVSSIGIISERFYGTRFLYQYELEKRYSNDIKISLSIGWDFEFKQFISCMGISIHVF